MWLFHQNIYYLCNIKSKPHKGCSKNNTKKMGKKKSYILMILLALMMALFLFLNMDIPFVIDDYVYSRSFVGINGYCGDTDPSRHIDSLTELLNSLWWHIHFINGRFLIAGMQHVFCAILPKWVYDILLTLLFLALLYLLAYGQRGRNVLPRMAMAAMLFLFAFNSPSTFYEGVSVTINYVLPAVLNISFLILLHKKKNDMSLMSTPSLWLILLALGASLCHENFSVPIAGTLFLTLLFRWRHLSKGMRIIFMTYIIGAAVIVLAPANFQRLTITNAEATTDGGGILYHIYVLKMLRITYLYALLVLILALRRGRRWLIQYIISNGILLSCLLLSLLFAMMIGALNGRVVYATEIFATILMLSLFEGISIISRHATIIACLCLLLCSLLLVAVTHAEQPYLTAFHKAESQVEECHSDTCIINTMEQDTLPPQMQKYIVATMSPFQKEQWRWKNKKKYVR